MDKGLEGIVRSSRVQPLTDVQEIRDVLRSIGVEHLDDVHLELTQKWKLLASLGIRRKRKRFATCDVKEELVRLGVFDPGIQAYPKHSREKIIGKILSLSGKFESFYVGPFIDETTRRENVRIAVEELIHKEKIEHLDDVDAVVSRRYTGFWNSVGIRKKDNYHSTEDIKSWLVALNFFKSRIDSYDEDIARKIVEGILNPVTSSYTYYLCNSLDENTLKANLLFAWAELRKREHIEHLDKINGKLSQKYLGFWRSIGVKKEGNSIKVDSIKARLVELGLFSPKICDGDYEECVRKEIIEGVLHPDNTATSHYLSYSLDESVWKENLDIAWSELKQREGIGHLDDIDRGVQNSYMGFWHSIGINKVSTSNIKRRLINLGLLKPRISDYSPDIQKRIVKKILPPNTKSKSGYLDSTLDEKIRKENITLIWTAFKEREKIEHLDDLHSRRSCKYTAIWYVLGVKRKGKGQFSIDDIKNSLVAMGLFSPKISDYEINIQKRIIEGALVSTGTFKSYYIRGSLEYSSWIDNVKTIWDALRAREKIGHLDDLQHRNMSKYLRFLISIGVKKGKIDHPAVDDIKARLVELGLFSPRISDKGYEEDIRKKIIERSLHPLTSTSPYYLSDSLDGEVWRENLNLVWSALKEREAIHSLDDLDQNIAMRYNGLWTAIGVKKSAKGRVVNAVRKRLIELGLFCPQISACEESVRQRIIENILRPWSAAHSFYLDKSLDDEVWNENVKIVLSEIINRENIEKLDGVNSYTLRKYHGINGRIGVKRNGPTFKMSAIRSRFVHLGFFNEDVERDYEFLRETGSAVELQKKLDRELFAHKGISVDESKVDKVSLIILQKVHQEAQGQGLVLRNALELFEHYKRNYDRSNRPS